jgi:hypothetical protein
VIGARCRFSFAARFSLGEAIDGGGCSYIKGPMLLFVVAAETGADFAL